MRTALLVLAALMSVFASGLGVDTAAKRDIAVDGDAGEWLVGDLVHPPFYIEAVLSEEPMLYSAYKGGYHYFYLKPPQGSRLLDSVIWLNIDQDVTTGVNTTGFFMPKGTDAYVYLPTNSNLLQIFKGCPPTAADFATCATLLGTAEAASVADGGIEFRVERAVLDLVPDLADQDGAQRAQDIDMAVQIQFESLSTAAVNTIYAPRWYMDWYAVYDLAAMPPCPNARDHRGAVLYSEIARDRFVSKMEYSNLFMSMQHQLFQAGLPYDRVDMGRLLEPQRMCHFKVVIITKLTAVRDAQWYLLRKALFELVHIYGVSIVTAGNVATNSFEAQQAVHGNPYHLMLSILGVSNDDPVYSVLNTVNTTVSDTDNAMFMDLAVGDELMEPFRHGPDTSMYTKAPGSAYEVAMLAEQFVNGVPYAAILHSHLPSNPWGLSSGHVVHFATLQLLGNIDSVWRAIRLLVLEYSDGISFGLSLGRQRAIMAMRVDMDLSQFNNIALDAETYFFEGFVRPWDDVFNLVGSYFINVGNETRSLANSNPKFTNWTELRPLYAQFLALGNEIGSHSYTHPGNINLEDIDLRFQFKDSLDSIAGNMSLARARVASAQPGRPNNFETAKAIEPFHEEVYWSGGYSKINAFGFFDDSSQMVYLAPNLPFDFSLIQFDLLTPEEAQQVWLDEMDLRLRLSRTPIFHWPIHDYGPISWGYEGGQPVRDTGEYNARMFEATLEKAYDMNVEFVTCMQLSDRIRAFSAASMTVTSITGEPGAGGGWYAITIPANSGHSYGAFSLALLEDEPGHAITNVDNWFAFNEERLFLPSNGGTFRVQVGATGSGDVNALPTRVSKLDMRMELASATGDGNGMSFTVEGKGLVTIALNRAFPAIAFIVTGATVIEVGTLSNTIVLSLPTLGQHDVEVALIDGYGPQPTNQPSIESSEASSESSDSNSLSVAGSFGISALVLGAGAVVAALIVWRKRQAKSLETASKLVA